MHDNNRINGYYGDGDLAWRSTEGDRNYFDFDNEPHEQDEGHVVHTLLPEQAARLPHHEAATLFPIKQSDIDRLKRSIWQFGQQIPAVLYDDEVLDGRCRIDACVALELPVLAVRFSESDLNGLTPKQWVLHRNRSATDGRRMTDTEYALIIAAVYGPEASEQALQRKQGGVAVVGELRGETSEMLGTIFNLSSNLMKQALKVFNSGDADLLQMVKDKKLSLSKAAEILKLPKAKRKAAMKNPKAPAPLTSSKDAIKAFKRGIKSLEKAEKRIAEIAKCEHFCADTRAAIEPTLASLQIAISQLRESQTEKDETEAKE